MNQEREDILCMDLAFRAAEESHDPKHKVGCLIKTPDHQITLSWNGMPEGMDNEMRAPHLTMVDGTLQLQMLTKPHVLHAEMNGIAKFAGSTASMEGAHLYCTLSPCIPCAVAMHRAKIVRVRYALNYKDPGGIDFLLERGIDIKRI